MDNKVLTTDKMCADSNPNLDSGNPRRKKRTNKVPERNVGEESVTGREKRPNSGKNTNEKKNDKDRVTSAEGRPNSGGESAKKKGKSKTDKDSSQLKTDGSKGNTKGKNEKGNDRESANRGGNTPKGRDYKNSPNVPKQIFEPYWSVKELSDGLKRGQLIQGPLRINPKNYEECYVPHPDGVSDIFISGMKDRNRAMNGDVVAVKIYDRRHWRVDMNNVAMYEDNENEGSTSGNGPEKKDTTLTDQGLGQNEVKDKDSSLAKKSEGNITIENDEDSDPDVVIESEEEVDLVTGKSTKLSDNCKKKVNGSSGNSAIKLNPSNEQKDTDNNTNIEEKLDIKKNAGDVGVDEIKAGVSKIDLVSNGSDKSQLKRNSSRTNCSKVDTNKARGNSANSTPKKKYTSLHDVLQEGSPVVKKLSETNADMHKYLQRTGKVVGIIEQKHSRACSGSLKLMEGKLKSYKAMFVPMDSRIPRIIIPLEDCPEDMRKPRENDNTLMIARITDWPETSQMAHGKLMGSLGEAGEIEPETERILIENDVDFSDFSPEALDCLPVHNLPWVIPEKEFSYRRDFRDVCIFTIDPSTARDLDDAVSIEKLKDGTYEVGVHIADVSHFLEEGTMLDKIASLRATSVYLVQKVVPMLPRILCEQLCSLNPNEDKLTFSVVWKMSDSGEIFEEWFGKSVINSCVKLSYNHAQGFIDEPDREWQTDELPPIARFSIDHIKKRVLMLNKIAVCLRKKRFDGGALRLDQVKVQYSLDPQTGLPNGYSIYEQKDSNRLIEEFMLLANMAVANKINSTYPSLALLRRHPAPQTKKVDELSALCESLGVPLDTTSAGHLQESLWNYCGDDEFSSARMQVLVSLCSKSMQTAVYFCTGSIDDEELYRHYALNVPLYTHFTSPIRRYADVIVHRQLAAALGIREESSQSVTDVQKQANRCNDKKMNAKRVQDLSSELFFAVFVKEAGPFEEKAIVMGVLDKSFDVFIMKFGVIKRVYCDKLHLKEMSYRREQKVPVLTITWASTEKCKEEITQNITMFSVIECVMQTQSDDIPLAWKVTLRHPKDKYTS